MLAGLPIIGGVTLAAAGTASAYYATYAVRSQWLGSTIWRGETDTDGVALTFDDGPSADTERVLDILAQCDIRATFFMLGRQVELFPQTARRVAESGHEIGNHSYSHPIYLYRGGREISNQLARTQQIIFETVGVKPRIARPPGGVRNAAYFRAARALGLQTVQWTVTGFDWKKRTPGEIARSVLKNVSPGSIILLHDGDSANRSDRKATIAALPLIFEGLKRSSLRISPLAQLVDYENASAINRGANPPMRKQHNA